MRLYFANDTVTVFLDRYVYHPFPIKNDQGFAAVTVFLLHHVTTAACLLLPEEAQRNF